MSYELLSMEDTGTSTGDIIMRLRWRPSHLRRWFGAQEELVAYYGQDDQWHSMDGLPAPSRVRAMLEALWKQRQERVSAEQDSSELAPCFSSQIQRANLDLVESASQDSFPASDPPVWTLGR